MFDPAAHLATMYAVNGEAITPAVGDSFMGSLRFDDASDIMLASHITLRYPVAGAPDLLEGAVVTARGLQWRLAEDPAPVGDGNERIVPLTKVTA